jgi:P-type Ca2+ transporter type 2C
LLSHGRPLGRDVVKAWRSALSGFFENKWLLGAVALCLFAHVFVIYVPFLQAAFHTVSLSPFDWAITTGVAATLLLGMELAKWVLRAKRQAPSTQVASGKSPDRG